MLCYAILYYTMLYTMVYLYYITLILHSYLLAAVETAKVEH